MAGEQGRAGGGSRWELPDGYLSLDRGLGLECPQQGFKRSKPSECAFREQALRQDRDMMAHWWCRDSGVGKGG